MARRQATAAAKVKNNRLRPGTKVLGRPSFSISKATSRVSDVSLIWPSTPMSMKWSWPSRLAQSGKRRRISCQHHKSLIQLDSVPLAVVKSDRLDMRKSL